MSFYNWSSIYHLLHSFVCCYYSFNFYIKSMKAKKKYFLRFILLFLFLFFFDYYFVRIPKIDCIIFFAFPRFIDFLVFIFESIPFFILTLMNPKYFTLYTFSISYWYRIIIFFLQFVEWSKFMLESVFLFIICFIVSMYFWPSDPSFPFFIIL